MPAQRGLSDLRMFYWGVRVDRPDRRVTLDIDTSFVQTLHATSLPSSTVLSEGQERLKLEAGPKQLTSIEDGNTVMVTRLKEVLQTSFSIYVSPREYPSLR